MPTTGGKSMDNSTCQQWCRYNDRGCYQTLLDGRIVNGKLVALPSNMYNSNIIVVEDIVDTGYTLKEVMSLFKYKGASSVEIACLLDKPSGRKTDLPTPKYVCNTIGPGFVVGFGLDYNQLYRNLNYIGILKKEVYS